MAHHFVRLDQSFQSLYPDLDVYAPITITDALSVDSNLLETDSFHGNGEVRTDSHPEPIVSEVTSTPRGVSGYPGNYSSVCNLKSGFSSEHPDLGTIREMGDLCSFNYEPYVVLLFRHGRLDFTAAINRFLRLGPEFVEHNVDNVDMSAIGYISTAYNHSFEVKDFELVMSLLHFSSGLVQLCMTRKQVYDHIETYTLTSTDSRPSKNCDICLNGNSAEDNPLCICGDCGLVVHEDCYGVIELPEGTWRCKKCLFIHNSHHQSHADLEASIVCVFCNHKRGAFKKFDTGEWVHLICALSMPNVDVPSSSATLEPISGFNFIDKNRYQLTCTICKNKKGACIQCAKNSCHTSFHAYCACLAIPYFDSEVYHTNIEFILQRQQNVIFYCNKHAKKGRELRLAHPNRGLPMSHLQDFSELIKLEVPQEPKAPYNNNQIRTLIEKLDQDNNTSTDIFQRASYTAWRTPQKTLHIPEFLVEIIHECIDRTLDVNIPLRVLFFVCRYYTMRVDQRNCKYYTSLQFPRLSRALDIALNKIKYDYRYSDSDATSMALMKMVTKLHSLLNHSDEINLNTSHP